MQVYYHATPTRYLNRILKEGLRGTGVKSGSTASRRYTKGKIYLWFSFSDAVDFAEQVAGMEGGAAEWTVLKVELPDDYRVFEDEEIQADFTAVYVRDSLPPRYLAIMQSWDVVKDQEEKGKEFRERFPDYKSGPPVPVWASGSQGGKWIPRWSMGIDYQLKTYEDIARRYPKDRDSIKIRDFLKRLKAGEVSEEEKEQLIREYPLPSRLV